MNDKYYIEVGCWESPCEYVLQSRFFDTEQQAIEWAKGLTFIDKNYTISLMKAPWNDDDDTYGDIDFIRYLDKELGI